MKFFTRERLVVLLITALAGIFILPPAGATLQGLQVGAEAPDFSLRSTTGESRSFNELHGDKLTVVLFWATWSRNSQAALSRMEGLYRKYRDQGLGIIAINADSQEISPEAEADITTIAEQLKLDYPLLLDDQLQTFHDYGIIALPSLLVLNSDRTIRYEMSGFPLMGAEEMVDFISATMEGRNPTTEGAKKAGYQPVPKALHYFNMARKTLKSGRMAQSAETWFKKAIEADASFLEPRLSLGRFYLGQREFDKAAEQFSQVLSRDPENAAALCESAMLLARNGKEKEAEARLEKGLEADQYYTPCYYYLGYLKGKRGALDQALPLFDQALEINRTSPETYYYQGRMYEERQQPQLAAEAYRKSLEMLLGEN
jgi:tetratricopeptide (TPR) repeat protein